MKPTEPRVEDFKLRDAGSYDPVVGSYDRFAERFGSPVARRMADLARLPPDARVLDVATGTGLVALLVARHLGTTGRVQGVDLSQGMIATARAKALREGLHERATFEREDAERLSFANGTFDAVFSLYALMHFPRPEVAVSEMRRVLRPGGTLVVAVGCAPVLATPTGVAYALRRLPGLLAERHGRALPAPAFLDRLVRERLAEEGEEGEAVQGPLAHSRRHPALAVQDLLRSAGFTDLESRWHASVGVVPTPEEHWELSATFSSFARHRLQSAPPETVETLKRDFLATCHRVQHGGGRLTYPHSAFILRATAGMAPTP